MRYDLKSFKKDVDTVVALITDVLFANDARIETALRTLLAEPGSPHSGAAAALADLDDRTGVEDSAENAIGTIENF